MKVGISGYGSPNLHGSLQEGELPGRFKAKLSIFRLSLLLLLPFLFTLEKAQVAFADETAGNFTRQGQIFLKATVEKSKVPLNELLWLTVRMGWIGDQADLEIAPPVFHYLEEFKIMERVPWKMQQEKAGPLVVAEYRFLLKPLILGNSREIPPLTIRFREVKDRNKISVLTTRLLKVDVIQAEAKPLSKLSIAGFVVGLFSLIFLLVFALTFIRRTYQKEQPLIFGPYMKTSIFVMKNQSRNGSSR